MRRRSLSVEKKPTPSLPLPEDSTDHRPTSCSIRLFSTSPPPPPPPPSPPPLAPPAPPLSSLNSIPLPYLHPSLNLPLPLYIHNLVPPVAYIIALNSYLGYTSLPYLQSISRPCSFPHFSNRFYRPHRSLRTVPESSLGCSTRLSFSAPRLLLQPV
ncbi:uncharacterized protein BO95DRAFT_177120 [Aspergillus brunneoviolaceus CBS 621.78]|uniref:Uncharacterized protein n=1 Tax=Aspergillus brunneoviolaceus CBS 621.78 TaxID=1450534 RepID=A0ACD1G5C9_9EURO|nr:hypothetical protein BO95DRAFT_177120 [Aspergillus brunneoviolaceus CBS 621.78]RAH44377.1 hypothetical protein BO95DRAFT_177120 [Aspergillus brunneoviolaceus CBS 621.78]